MNQIMHPDLLEEIRAFCDARGMALTRFGTEALGDPNFVSQLVAGRECRRATLTRVRSFMAEHSLPGAAE